MTVSVPLHTRLMKRPAGAKEMHSFYSEFYARQKLVKVMPFGAEQDLPGGMIGAHEMAGRDDLEIYVCGNDERSLLVSRFDNLGKGASGAAVQSMNILLGLDETEGLSLMRRD